MQHARADGIRPGEHLDQAFGDAQGVVGRVQVLEQDDELVAADARGGARGRAGAAEQVGAAQRALQPLRDLAQQLVARRVAVGVVDLLEAVEVHEQHREVAVRRLLPAPQRQLDAFEDDAAVRQARQRVGARAVAQLLVQRQLLGHVDVRAGHAHRPAVGAPFDDRARRDHARPAAVGALQAQHAAVRHARIVEVRAQCRAPALAVLGVNERLPGARRRVGRRSLVAEHAPQALVAARGAVGDVTLPHAHARALDGQREQPLARALLGDVDEAGHRAGDAARGVAHRLAVDEQPAQLALGRQHAHHLAAHRLAAGQRARRRLLGERVVAQVLAQGAPAAVGHAVAEQLRAGQPQHLLGRRVAVDHGAGRILQHDAHRQRGEQRGHLQPLLDALGDVGLDTHEAARPAGVVDERLHVEVDPVLAAVLRAVEQLDAHAAPGVERLAQAGHGRGVGALALQQLARRTADRLGERVAAQAREGVVGPHDAALDVGDEHDVVRALGREREPLELAGLRDEAQVLAAHEARRRLGDGEAEEQQQADAQQRHVLQLPRALVAARRRGGGELVAQGARRRLRGVGFVLHLGDQRPELREVAGAQAGEQCLGQAPHRVAALAPRVGRRRRGQVGVELRRFVARALQRLRERVLGALALRQRRHARDALGAQALRLGELYKRGVGSLLAAAGARGEPLHGRQRRRGHEQQPHRDARAPVRRRRTAAQHPGCDVRARRHQGSPTTRRSVGCLAARTAPRPPCLAA